MNRSIIHNAEELNAYIEANGDYNPDMTFLSYNPKTNECFAVPGCTYASDAENFNCDYALVITDENYEKEIADQISSDCPELCGFPLHRAEVLN